MNRNFLIRIVAVSALLFPVAQISAQEIEDDGSIPAAIKPVKGNSCVECHKKLTGKLRFVVPEWERSVHALKGNQCNICHGGNPNIYDEKLSKSEQFQFVGRPKQSEISDFCGREGCHRTALTQFKKGPHFRSVQKTGEPNCVTCHSEHGIQRSSRNILTEKICTECHDIAYSREIINTVFKIEDEIQGIEKDVTFLKRRNAQHEDIEDKLNSTKHLFYQLVHVFSREDMVFTKKIIELEIRSLKDIMITRRVIVSRLDLIYILSLIFSVVIIFAFVLYIVRFYGKSQLP